MFWFITVLLSVAAVTIAVLPLLRRVNDQGPEHQALNAVVLASQRRELEQDLADGVIDAQRFKQAQEDLAREAREAELAKSSALRVGHSAFMALVLAVAIPALAFTVYDQVGTPKERNTAHAPQAMGITADEIGAMISRLQQRLESNPNDPAGWAMLARSLYSTGQPEEALHALKSAFSKGIEHANLYAQYADLLANEQGGFAGEPSKFIKKALALDPDNEQALWLAGTEALDEHDLKTAIRHWERLHALLDPASEDAIVMQDNLRAVRAELAGTNP